MTEKGHTHSLNEIPLSVNETGKDSHSSNKGSKSNDSPCQKKELEFRDASNANMPNDKLTDLAQQQQEEDGCVTKQARLTCSPVTVSAPGKIHKCAKKDKKTTRFVEGRRRVFYFFRKYSQSTNR
jgi:hypothetical protein